MERLIRGQIWEHISGSHQHRVVIISSDEFNDLPRVQPWALALLRDPAMPLSIPLSAEDPVPGAWAAVPLVLRIHRTGLRRNLGYLSHATMTAVERELRDFLALP